MGRIGGGELLVIALIALLLFGAGRLSDIGKGLGEGIKNFKKGLRDDEPTGDAAKSTGTAAPAALEAKPEESSKKA